MFEGVYTALVTPFLEDGSVDYHAYGALIENQIKAGVDGIVPVGTTGESPTLNFEEHAEVIRFAVSEARGKVKVIAGTGGNSTSEALELTQHAASAGADGSLQVTPYYNKPSRAGLKAHFETLADVGLPTVLYNVPGRSALEIPVDLIAELNEHDAIVSVKEAGGSVDRVSQIKAVCDIEVLSGDDPLTLPMMSVGAVGVISVASNIIPGQMADLTHNALMGKWSQAADIHNEYYGLFKGLFMETNPIPVKTALALMGQMKEIFRLPLAALDDEQHEALERLLQEYALI